MRLTLLSLLCFLVTFPALSQRLSKEVTQQKLMAYLEKYSPSSHTILSMMEDMPDEFDISGSKITLSPEQSPLTWLSERTEEGIIGSLNTVVHESLHGFTSRYPMVLLSEDKDQQYRFGDDYSAFYIDDSEIYLVKHTVVFSSNKLKQHIPKKLRTFRFDPYIVPKDDNLGSQIQGIYGLLDEWNAYYHGTKTAYDLFEYYKDKAADDNQRVYLEHVSNLAGTYFAYYEFKYYILKYLDLAAKNYTEVHRRLMNNLPLRQAYTAIDEKFSGLLAQFEERLDTIENLVGSVNNTSVYRKDGYYFIGNNGVGLFSEEAELLKQELNKNSMIALDQELKIKRP